MKIVVFHNLPAGGAKRTLYEEVKALSKKHMIDLYEFDSTDESFLDIRSFVKKVRRYPFDLRSTLPGFFARIEKDCQNFIELCRLHKKIAGDINKGRYDVALIHADKFTQAPFLLRYLKIPALYFCQEWLRIVYERELLFKEDVIFLKRGYELVTRKIRKEIDKKNAQSASKIITNSNFTKLNIKKAYKKDIISCHLGVNTEIFKPLPNKRDYFLFVGEKAEINGYSLVENAVKMVKEDVKPEIKIIGISKGRLSITSDKIMAREYSGALVTLCTSFNEPFGLAPIESMACGTPVLAVDEGGYRETVIDGKTGFLLKRDPKIFADKIVYLIRNPKVVKRLGDQGRKHVIKNFSWDTHVAIVEKTLLEIARQR